MENVIKFFSPENCINTIAMETE